MTHVDVDEAANRGKRGGGDLIASLHSGREHEIMIAMDGTLALGLLPSHLRRSGPEPSRAGALPLRLRYKE